MEYRIATWAELTKDEFYEIARLRAEVFYLEQRVTEQDFDEVDRAEGTFHLWLAGPDGLVAYLRAYPLVEPEQGATFSFGRVAVRSSSRGQRLSSRLVDKVLQRWGDQAMLIHAQEYVVGLYAAHGFEPVGESYEEAGIWHRKMYRPGQTSAESAS